MPGAGDRQELGDAFDDAQQDDSDEVVQAVSPRRWLKHTLRWRSMTGVPSRWIGEVVVDRMIVATSYLGTT